MKRLKYFILFASMISTFFSFNSFAMTYNEDTYYPERRTPQNEEKHEDENLNYKWTWLNDDTCVQFRPRENSQRNRLESMYELGLLTPWTEDKKDGNNIKQRESYSGKWSQAEGVWSFAFDDYTIPVGPTKIDGVLYAFNGYGELQEGYNYWGDLKTAADGLVTSDDPEFLAWLATQYVPECFTQTETADTGASGPGQNN